MLITIAIKSPRMNVINWCRYWTDLEDYSNVSNVAAFMKFNVMIVLYYKISYLSNFLYFSFFIYTIFKSSIVIKNANKESFVNFYDWYTGRFDFSKQKFLLCITF